MRELCHAMEAGVLSSGKEPCFCFRVNFLYWCTLFAFVLLFCFVNLTQAIVIWEQANSVEVSPPSDWPVGKPVRVLPGLMTTVGGPSPLGAVPFLGRWS